MLSTAIQLIYRLPYFPGQWRIAGALRKLLPKGIGLFRDAHGIRYYVHEASHIGHSLASGHVLESDIDALVPSRSLGLVVDAGCNAGTFCLPLAKRARAIVAIDADADQIGLLRRSAAINGFDNVHAVHAAVTSRAVETETFHIARSLKDLSSRDAAMLAGRDDYTTKTVPALSLARIVREHGPIDLLKIDIEGFSGDAIVSLADAVSQVDTIVAEPSPDMAPAVRFLEDAGFTVTQPLAKRADLPDHLRYTYVAVSNAGLPP